MISPLSGLRWGTGAGRPGQHMEIALASGARGGIKSVSGSTASGLHTAYKDISPSKVSALFSKEF